MVCKVVESVLCIIRDHSGVSSQHKFEITLPPDAPVRELINEVANFFNYEPDSFELTLQKGENEIIVSEKTEGTLEKAGFSYEPNARNPLILSGLGTPAPILRASPVVEDDLSLGASASPTGTCTAGSSDYPPAPPLPPPLSSSSTSNAAITEYPYNTSALIKPDTGYVGLVNQAMTCYLNSLLQALFMTPEFRNALYKWQFEANESLDEAKSIPYQLQKLFLNLQTSNRNAVETTELTRSFGWDSSEAWQQHDIQELCRVMFDALEHVLKDTQQADLIDRLYQGKMIDYVKCLDCAQEKSREDTFLDIPLPVRPFGSTVAYGSVEEALRAFVQPETLEGSNQYHCDTCAKKCDAHKGLKFSKFPYLLTLHLKRFDFDYNTMHRIKLNDKVVFPEILDLNSFIQREKDDGSEGIPEELAAGKCDDSSTTDSGSALDDESCQGTNELSQTDAVQEDDEGIDVSGGSNGGNHHENEKNRQHTIQKGPFVYELFSIMIHSGSASGGHYYAYIKDFTNGEWFCFNDQTVNRITNDDIAKTYGGGIMRGYYSGAYSSSTNAYMLMYRQIDKERNCYAMTEHDFPPHIKELYKKLQEREETDRQRKEKESEMCKIKLYCYIPGQGNNAYETKLYCSNDTTLKEATELAYKLLKLEGVVPLEQCRLVSYCKLQDTIEVSFEGQDDELIVNILNNLRTYRSDLLMEIRNKDQKFIEYQPGGMTLRVYYVDLVTEEVEGPTLVRGNISQTIGELKESIGAALNMKPSEMNVVYEKFGVLTDYTRTLKQEAFHAFMKVFVRYEPSDPDKQYNSHDSPKLNKILDRFEHTVTLQIALPDTDPETLSNLSIPSLNSPSTSLSSPSTNCYVTSSNTPNGSKSNELINTNDRGDKVPGGAGATVAGSVTAGTAGGTGDTGGGGRSRDLLLPLLLTDVTTASDVVTTNNTVLTTAMTTETASSEAEETGSQGAGGGDQSTSEDSSLTDSDRTLIGDVPDDYTSCNHTDVIRKTNMQEYIHTSYTKNDETEFQSNVPRFSGIDKFYENYNNVCTNNDEWVEEDENVNNYTYFKATPYTSPENEQKMLKVQVDKRMLLGYFKTSLEPYVGVPAIYFRLYRMHPGQQECEYAVLKDSLLVFRDNEQLTIKLGRALRGGEHRVKVFHLQPDVNPPVKFLCDYIIGKGQTIAETKRELLEELSRKNLIKIPLDRCRLRKKNWKSPVKAYLDNEVWGYDIVLESNTDIFLQELSGPEIVKSSTQCLLFVRRWSPSKFQLGPFQEIVMDGRTVNELKTKISEISEIPIENVEFAKPHAANPFPCDISVLLVNDLEWNHSENMINDWPLQVTEDGSVIFYRDSREELKQLTPEERKKISTKENAKKNFPSSTISSYSTRVERPLKIYLDSTPRRPRPRTMLEPDID